MYFQSTIHSFRPVKVTGTASLKVNLVLQLIAMREEVLYEVLLYLRKAYDALDREH